MIVSCAFFFWVTMSGLLWWISRSVCGWLSPTTVYFLILFYAFGECSHHLSLHSTPDHIHCTTPNVWPARQHHASFYILSGRAWGNYTKYATQFHRDYHIYFIWMIHFGFRFWLLRRSSSSVHQSPSSVHQFLSSSKKHQISPLSLSCHELPMQHAFHSFGVSISSTFFLFHAALAAVTYCNCDIYQKLANVLLFPCSVIYFIVKNASQLHNKLRVFNNHRPCTTDERVSMRRQRKVYLWKPCFGRMKIKWRKPRN